jgi:hypothetical protein
MMSSQPGSRVTIVIPTVSRPLFVERAVERARRRWCKHELLVSDNGFTDEQATARLPTVVIVMVGDITSCWKI